jgi:hypothetical protein
MDMPQIWGKGRGEFSSQAFLSNGKILLKNDKKLLKNGNCYVSILA